MQATDSEIGELWQTNEPAVAPINAGKVKMLQKHRQLNGKMLRIPSVSNTRSRVCARWPLTMYSASKTLMFMRCNQIFDDEGAPGLKTPSLTLTPDPARARGQDQDQALRYA